MLLIIVVVFESYFWGLVMEAIEVILTKCCKYVFVEIITYWMDTVALQTRQLGSSFEKSTFLLTSVYMNLISSIFVIFFFITLSGVDNCFRVEKYVVVIITCSVQPDIMAFCDSIVHTADCTFLPNPKTFFYFLWISISTKYMDKPY